MLPYVEFVTPLHELGHEWVLRLVAVVCRLTSVCRFGSRAAFLQLRCRILRWVRVGRLELLLSADGLVQTLRVAIR